MSGQNLLRDPVVLFCIEARGETVPAEGVREDRTEGARYSPRAIKSTSFAFAKGLKFSRAYREERAGRESRARYPLARKMQTRRAHTARDGGALQKREHPEFKFSYNLPSQYRSATSEMRLSSALTRVSPPFPVTPLPTCVARSPKTSPD